MGFQSFRSLATSCAVSCDGGDFGIGVGRGKGRHENMPARRGGPGHGRRRACLNRWDGPRIDYNRLDIARGELADAELHGLVQRAGGAAVIRREAGGEIRGQRLPGPAAREFLPCGMEGSPSD